MADKTGIEWTDATWNPIVGCDIVSPGCTNCYAMKMAARIEAMQPSSHYAGTTKRVNGNAVWTGKLAQASEDTLTQPLRWKTPKKIFVNSMGDLFHENVPNEWIDRVFAVMALCPQHTFQVLTKRSKRMREYFQSIPQPRWINQMKPLQIKHLKMLKAFGVMLITPNNALPNVWLGVSCEDQQRADERIPDLFAIPAAVRFVSAEPLLGPINIASSMITNAGLDALFERLDRDKTIRKGGSLSWILVGGEFGPKARPMHPEWVRSIRDQCAEAGTAFFFKKWGEFVPCVFDEFCFEDGAESEAFNDPKKHPIVAAHGRDFWRIGKARAGHMLDGKEHFEFPKVMR